MRTPAAAREGAISRISAVQEVARTPRDGRAPSGAAEIPAHVCATGTKLSLLFTGPTPFLQDVVRSPKNTGRSLRTQVRESNFFFCPTSVARGPGPASTSRTRPPRDRAARNKAARNKVRTGSARGADQALLHDGHHPVARFGEDLAPGQPAGPGRDRRFLGVP